MGKGIEAVALAGGSPVSLSGGSGDVYAFVRARPGEAEAPVVVRLVDWGDTPKPLSVRFRRAAFFGDRPVSAKLLTPAAFDKAAHEKADATGDFSKLLVEKPLADFAAGKKLTVPPHSLLALAWTVK